LTGGAKGSRAELKKRASQNDRKKRCTGRRKNDCGGGASPQTVGMWEKMQPEEKGWGKKKGGGQLKQKIEINILKTHRGRRKKDHTYGKNKEKPQRVRRKKGLKKLHHGTEA